MTNYGGNTYGLFREMNQSLKKLDQGLEKLQLKMFGAHRLRIFSSYCLTSEAQGKQRNQITRGFLSSLHVSTKDNLEVLTSDQTNKQFF